MGDPIGPALFERIVVGVDGSDGGRDALALAALLQRVGGGELIAVHVYSLSRTVDPASAQWLGATLAQNLLRSELSRAGVRARRAVVMENSPARALHNIADRHEAQLIVVGASHLTGVDRVLAGDDATSTLHGAPCAVAVAPRGFAQSGGDLRLVGVGLDGSPEARCALALARRIARRAGAGVRATTVVRPARPSGPFPAWEPARPVYEDRARQSGTQLLDRILTSADGDVATDVAVGKAWDQLAWRSADVDLLVLGARSLGPARRLLLGSTSTKLVRRTRCPLLVVPRGARTTAGAAPTPQRPLRLVRT
jgi:nucleotide-binding universal stress UspA family protein